MSDVLTVQKVIDDELSIGRDPDGQTTIEIVDPKTGEIKTVLISELEQTDRLIRLASVISRAKDDIDNAKRVYNLQITMIQAEHAQTIEALESTINYLNEKCAHTLDEMGQLKLCSRDKQDRPVLKIAGVGAFGWRKQQPLLNDDEWQNMTVEQQAVVARDDPEYFKFIYQPNKTAIKARIKEENNGIIEGFILEPASADKFNFTRSK